MADNNSKRYKNIYTSLAPTYHSTRYDTVYGKLFRQLHHQMISQELTDIKTDDKILEVACGTGHTSELLKNLNLNFVSCDLTIGMMNQAREKIGGDDVFFEADAFQLPIASDSVDVLISTRFMHLFKDSEQRNLINEMIRVLKPGGKLIIDFDNFVSRWILAIPHLLYNLLRYRRCAPEAYYNRIKSVESLLTSLNCVKIRSVGVGGYHLYIPAIMSRNLAYRLGILHKHTPLRTFSEQFITSCEKKDHG